MAKPSGRDIRAEVLAANRRAMQASGLAGCNYSELARTLGVRAPSIHHHFATRHDLVLATTERYCDDFEAAVAQLDTNDVEAALRRYAELFVSPASEGLLCLCGAVAADWEMADSGVRRRVERFFADQVDWLSERFAAGLAAGVFVAAIPPERLAVSLLAALEGALLVAGTGAVSGDAVGAATSLIDLVAA